MRIPPRKPDSWARWISATAAVDVEDRHDRHPARRSGTLAHSSASQRLWARAPASSSVGSRVAAGAESGAERSRRAAGDRVGVGEDDLADHAVGLELLVASGSIPSTAQALLVLPLPLLGELLVEDPALARAPCGRARSARLASNASGTRGRATRGTARSAVRRGSRRR